MGVASINGTLKRAYRYTLSIRVGFLWLGDRPGPLCRESYRAPHGMAAPIKGYLASEFAVDLRTPSATEIARVCATSSVEVVAA